MLFISDDIADWHFSYRIDLNMQLIAVPTFFVLFLFNLHLFHSTVILLSLLLRQMYLMNVQSTSVVVSMFFKKQQHATFSGVSVT